VPWTFTSPVQFSFAWQYLKKGPQIFTPIFLHFFVSELLLIISTVLGEKKWCGFFSKKNLSEMIFFVQFFSSSIWKVFWRWNFGKRAAVREKCGAQFVECQKETDKKSERLWGGLIQGCQIFLCTRYQKPEKCRKSTQNVRKRHKISQMSVNYSKWPLNTYTFSHLRPSKIYSNWDFLVWKRTIWQPWSHQIRIRSHGKKRSCCRKSCIVHSLKWTRSGICSVIEQSCLKFYLL
jgi:hypothetical protein